MKRHTYYIIAALLPAIVSAASCNVDEIQPYRLEDSAVVFSNKSNEFSIKGLIDSTTEIDIPVELIGLMTDYDRDIEVNVVDTAKNTAVEGKDFRIIYKTLDHDTYKGAIRLEINNLEPDVEELFTTLKISHNGYFIDGIPEYSTSVIKWTKTYVRPELGVWHPWYLYLSRTYSKSYHELLINILGDEIETATHKKNYVTQNPELTFHAPDWWSAASRILRQKVEEHDKADPEHPYMHSPDVRQYSDYNQSPEQGKPFETLPTILQTLNNI